MADILSEEEIQVLLNAGTSGGPTLDAIKELAAEKLEVLVRFSNAMVLAAAISDTTWGMADRVIQAIKAEKRAEFKAYLLRIETTDMAVEKAQNVLLSTFAFLQESGRL